MCRGRLRPESGRPYCELGVVASHSMLGPEDVRELAQRLGRTQLALSEHDEKEVAWLGAAMFAFSLHKWDELVQCAVDGQSPLLYCHASDGWGRTINKTKQVRFNDYMFGRSGKLRAELNLEKELLKSIDKGGEIHGVMGFVPPRPMMHGKSGWHISNVRSTFGR